MVHDLVLDIINLMKFRHIRPLNFLYSKYIKLNIGVYNIILLNFFDYCKFLVLYYFFFIMSLI